MIAADMDGVSQALAQTAHEKRLEQLTQDGLIQYYKDSRASKVVLFPPQAVAPPKPLRKGVGCNSGFHEKHKRIAGLIPGSGIFIFEDCYVGKAGTVMDRDRRVLYDDDLVSPYWMWFLGKMITKVVIDNARVGQSVIGRFIGGNDEAVSALRTPGFTLVNLTKPGSKVYGHWILDLLPMVYNFFEAVKAGAVKSPFKYLVADDTPGWAIRMLEKLFNIKPNDLISFDDNRQILHVDRLVVPSLLRVSPLISPRMNDFVDYVYDRLNIANVKLDVKLPRRLFISREAFAADDNRVLVNQDEVTETIAATGVTPIRPELLPWPEQVKLFAEAEVVIGEYGSGLHNTLFSPASTVSVVMVNLKSNWNQSSIAALRKQELVYVKPSMQERVGKANGIRFAFDPGMLKEALAAALS